MLGDKRTINLGNMRAQSAFPDAPQFKIHPFEFTAFSGVASCLLCVPFWGSQETEYVRHDF